MKKNKLKKTNIDFLETEKKFKNIKKIKIIAIFIIVIFIAFNFYSYIDKSSQINKLTTRVDKIKNENNQKKETISKYKKNIKQYNNKYRKTINKINSFIFKKIYPLEKDLEFIREKINEITITELNYKENSALTLRISSPDYTQLLDYKTHLEKRFNVAITGDEKKNGIFKQVLLVTQKKESKDDRER